MPFQHWHTWRWGVLERLRKTQETDGIVQLVNSIKNRLNFCINLNSEAQSLGLAWKKNNVSLKTKSQPLILQLC